MSELARRGQIDRLSRGKRVLHPPPPPVCVPGQVWIPKRPDVGRWPPRLVVVSVDATSVTAKAPDATKTRTYTMKWWTQLYRKE